MVVLTEELTFRIGTAGVVLNTDSAGMPFVDVESVRGLDSAEFRVSQRDWEGNDGSFMDAEFESGRTILITGTVYASTATMESYLDTLKANYAPSNSLKKFYFKSPGVNERFLYVKPLGIKYDWESMRRLGMGAVQISMFAEDPRIYDSTLQTSTVQQGATVFTGFSFNLGFNFGFGGTSTTLDSVLVTVLGNRPTPAVFTMSGPVTNPRILNDTTNSEMVFVIDVPASNTLVVDSKYRTVKLNGVTNRRSSLQSPTWFMLQPGDNYIRYRAGVAGTSTLTIEYYTAWR
jgi:hypothetical protein